MYIHPVDFEWNPAKNEANIEKHGIDFHGAQAIWDGEVVIFQSQQRHHSEKRYLAIGLYRGREIAAVYTRRHQTIPLISARRARKNERERCQTRMNAVLRVYMKAQRNRNHS